MSLETEITTYNAQLPNLLQHQGKFVVIKGEEVVDVLDTYNDALKLGYERFGLQQFLVKRIMPPEQVFFITRHVVPCQPSISK
ncbi:hypothetical protein [Pseudomonas citronellolis]|uniref:hypothetical protein n=1 Tax=Pseudomonas citronellolis TaxID=53408 RepID=UPI002270F57F|nr:hypothetical protein [Pseudomonas citronellolis]WAB91948.1 hypothetical protein OSS47_28185 [Pseudomonas citronellolis]